MPHTVRGDPEVTVATLDREPCALLSRTLGEELGGTAPVARGWIAVEHHGPWTPRAPSADELGAAADHLTTDGVRVQLVRPVRHQHVPPTAGHTVLLGHGGVAPDDRWLERLHLDHLDALLDLDPTVVLAPTAPGLGDRVEHDVWLVCAHARRDACCAVHGRPVAAALDAAGVEVWETTHTGGHRFAATAVVLPDGVSLGRLDTVDPVAVASDLAAGALAPGLLRGRCAVARPAQAAEAEVRQRTGSSGRDDVLPVAVDGDTVTVATPDGPVRVTVEHAPAAPPRPVSDGAAPTRPDRWVVTDVRPG